MVKAGGRGEARSSYCFRAPTPTARIFQQAGRRLPRYTAKRDPTLLLRRVSKCEKDAVVDGDGTGEECRNAGGGNGDGSCGAGEMRVVLGVQGADAPKHVSRAKT